MPRPIAFTSAWVQLLIRGFSGTRTHLSSAIPPCPHATSTPKLRACQNYGRARFLETAHLSVRVWQHASVFAGTELGAGRPCRLSFAGLWRRAQRSVYALRSRRRLAQWCDPLAKRRALFTPPAGARVFDFTCVDTEPAVLGAWVHIPNFSLTRNSAQCRSVRFAGR